MKRKREQGLTSVIVLGVMFVLLTVGISGAALTAGTMLRAEKDEKAMTAFQAAQAGMENEIAEAFAAIQETGEFANSERDVSNTISSLAPNATATAYIQPTDELDKAWITCTVTYQSVTRSVRTFVSAKDVSIWNNAIFAGSGAAGRAINGNVDIRGSVHILGEGEAYSDLNGNGQWDDAESYTDSNKNGHWDPGEPFVDTNGDNVWNSAEPYNDTNANGAYDPPLTTTDLSSTLGGTAYMGNNYYGMPSSMQAMLPSPPSVNGIETLGAELRVKHGMVSINGNAAVGSGDEINGGLAKGTIDGSYVNDGYTGNSGADHVFSDNGTSNQYDLNGIDFDFPLVSGIGSQEIVDPNGQTWTNYAEYYNNRSLSIAVASITSSTSAFSYGPDAYGNKIVFTPPVKSRSKIITPANIHVQGIVKITGDLTLGSSKDTITYSGSGTLYATQDINVSANLTPKDGKVFPTSAVIGLIAGRNMGLATGSGDSQLTMMAAFYAQGKITSAKQNQIAGTFVANFFDMGTNVPNIYQVPLLTKNMPPGMPGDKGIFTLKLKSWRERPAQ